MPRRPTGSQYPCHPRSAPSPPGGVPRGAPLPAVGFHEPLGRGFPMDHMIFQPTNDDAPLREDRLSEFERQLNHPLPQDYRSFLLEHNGGVPMKKMFTMEGDDYASEVDKLLPLGLDMPMPARGYKFDSVISASIQLGRYLPDECLTIGTVDIHYPLLIFVRGERLGQIYLKDMDEYNVFVLRRIERTNENFLDFYQEMKDRQPSSGRARTASERIVMTPTWTTVIRTTLSAAIAVVTPFDALFIPLAAWAALASRWRKSKGLGRDLPLAVAPAIVLAAYLAPVKEFDRLPERRLTLPKLEMTLAELSEPEAHGLPPSRQDYQMTIPEGLADRVIRFPSTELSVGEFVAAVEGQTPLRHRFRPGCGNTATILGGSPYFRQVNLDAPEP
ncbi:hypothetical protein HK102_011830 [Quaeritorhiza haematococci]|nr:hypothetical protein HK102_011830 [Quaeritorhiza haematococci]